MSQSTSDVSAVPAPAPEASSPVLVVDGLTVSTVNDDIVVDQVSFSVTSGRVLGLVGESGSGKTTLALAMLGHARRGLRITEGRIELDGKNLLEMSPSELRSIRGRQVAYVPQDPASALNPVLRIGLQVEEALKVHGVGREERIRRVSEVLSEVGIEPTRDVLHRFPHELSGGQQQRVAIAMAFAGRPAVIVLDEPTTGLDVSLQRQVLATIGELCTSYGVAAVYVSHDLAVVNGIADDVAVAYSGRIVELGPTDAVFQTPLHPYTKGLLNSVPSPERSSVLTGIPGQPPQIGIRPPGCAFAPRCAFAVSECDQAPPEPLEVLGRMVRCLRAGEISPRERIAAVEVPAAAPEIAARLRVRGLSGSYGSRQVLHDVDFDLGQRQCLAIVGESGAGKTTLAQCIAGLNSRWKGQALLDDTPLEANAKARDKDTLRRIQYVFQNPYLALNPRKTVRQIVMEALLAFQRLPRQVAEAEVVRVLDDVSLGTHYLHRYPDQLSGGERQRVAIARAVVVQPEVLICDEVTSALDVSVQAVIVELLRKLQVERGLSMLFITHNLALVRSIAQSCLVLSDGRIVESGPTTTILERPSDPYTQRLIADMPSLYLDDVPEPFAGGSDHE